MTLSTAENGGPSPHIFTVSLRDTLPAPDALEASIPANTGDDFNTEIAGSVSAITPVDTQFGSSTLTNDVHKPCMKEVPDSDPLLNFDDIVLLPSADSARIKLRWLDGFLPSESLTPKIMPPFTLKFIHRVLKTYPKKMLRRGDSHPIIHQAQTVGSKIPLPLANCLSLVQLWEGRAPGSEGIVSETVRQEMERLLREYASLSQIDLLAAFQSYLIYSMMIFYSDDPLLPVADRATMINLQELASHISSTGLVTTAELSHTRPSWESWIIAAAKRRSLYAMYMFQNVFNALNGIPVYLAEELALLPAPDNKYLWECRNRDVWEREYDRYLANWNGGGLRLCELWPHKAPGSSSERDARVDKWAESVDEFGMMLLAVCVHTHGS